MTGAAQVVAASLGAGVVLGVAWWLLAPVPRLRVRSGTAVEIAQRAETAVAADGWFAVCAAVVGAVAGLLAAVLVRRDRLGALLGLTAGGVLGSVLAWQLGQALGPDEVAVTGAGPADGTRFDGPLRLSALGVLLTWPTTAVIVFFAAVAGLDSVDPDDRASAGDVSPGGGWRPPGPP